MPPTATNKLPFHVTAPNVMFAAADGLLTYDQLSYPVGLATTIPLDPTAT